MPDCVTLRLDRRIVSEESRAAVDAELRAVSAGAATPFPRAGIDVRRILLATPLTPTPFAARLTTLLRQHASTEFGEPITAGGVPLYTDARHFAAAHYAAARVPIVLYGAGPRSIEDADAHRADERVRPANLHAATRVAALALADLLKAYRRG